MDLTIRPAELDDAPFMVSLVNDADGGMPFAIWTSLARPSESPWDVGLRRVRSDDTPVSWSMGWIAEDEGTPVGVVIVHQLSETPEQLEATIMSPLWVPFVALELEASGSAYVKTLSVIESMRGQGVGSRLLRFAEQFRGPEGMSVILGDHDGASRRFFERSGYPQSARRKVVKDGWQIPGTEWILLRKP